MSALDPASMRRLNAALTLRTVFQAAGPVTLTQLRERTLLSRRTIELILDELVAEGWVRGVRPAAAVGVGRPPKSFEFDDEHALLAGVVIDTHATEAAVSDLRGRLISRRRRTLSSPADPAVVLAEAGAALQNAISSSGRSFGLVRALGVAIGGVIDADGRMVALPNKPMWTGADPGRVLGDRFGIPVKVDNDANLAALAERWLGSAQDQSSFTWLLAGTRSGAGIVIDGRVHRGFQNAAGEIVHVQSMGVSELETNPLGSLVSHIPGEQQVARIIVDRARAGEREAQEVVRRFVDPVARLIVVLAWTLAPPVIVLGGGMSDAADVLIPLLKARIAAEGAPPIELRASGLGLDGPLSGAIHAARDALATDWPRALVEGHLVDPPR